MGGHAAGGLAGSILIYTAVVGLDGPAALPMLPALMAQLVVGAIALSLPADLHKQAAAVSFALAPAAF